MIYNREGLQSRLNFLWMSMAFGVSLLGMRLLQIQVIQNLYYLRAAERNRTQIIRQTAPRGLILDRIGEVLARSQTVFSLIYMPGKNRNQDYLSSLARELSPLIHKNPDDLLKTLLQAISEESPIRLSEKLPPKVMFKLMELRILYPDISPIDETRRYYPNGAFAAHLLGHMGRMDETSWKYLKRQGYRVDSWIGKAGIEKVFEGELRGEDGGIRLEVDVHGRLKRILERIPWKPGNNLVLTIDSRLQKVAEDALRNSMTKSGAVVVLDPRDGGILALASIPDFDPNAFLTPETAHASGLKNAPEFNLAVQGSYSPGSIFKIVSGAAILEQGHVDTRERVFCPGYFELGNRISLCWDKKGHRNQNWIQAMEHSCDVYFYQMGLRAGPAAIEKYEHLFRMGEKTAAGLPGESSGRVFGPDVRHARKMSWRDGDTLNLAIGQGELLVTPIQMAMVVAAVANRGTLWRPRFIDHIQYGDQSVFQYKPEILGHVPLLDSTWDELQQALIEVVHDPTGTGHSIQIPGLVIGGKTGTAQNPEGEDHAWFVAYAGKEHEPPRIAMAVLVRHGGHGGVTAGPVVKEIIQAAFSNP